MKTKYLFIIIPGLMLSTLALVAMCPSRSEVAPTEQAAKKPAQIKFEKELHDFGEFSRSDSARVTYDFVYANIGEQPLVIQDVKTSCGCTKASFSGEPVMPGQKGKVSVTYDGNEAGIGYFKKSVSITSNGSETPVTIYIRGTVTE